MFLNRIQWILLMTGWLSTALNASAQVSEPDYTNLGTSRIYWVDSTTYPGSIYTWRIDDAMVQCSTKCALVHTWKSSGEFTLSVQQTRADGCRGEIITKKVHVDGQVITIAANPDQSKIVGEEDPPEFTYTFWPALSPGDSLRGRLERVAGEEVGSYPILLGSLTAGPKNSIRYISADFRIWPKSENYIYVTALQNSKTEGDPDPPLEFIVSPASSRPILSGHLERDPGETPGTYWINSRLVCPKDYVIDYTGCWFTINPRIITDITVYADPQTKEYGNEDPNLTYRIEPEGTNARLTGNLGRNGDENVGVYSIHQGDLDAGRDFRITFVPATFEILPRNLTVTADPQRKPFTTPPTPDPPLTFTFSPAPLVGDDCFTGHLWRKAGENPGSYLIMMDSLTVRTPYRETSNYKLEYVSNYLEIYYAETHEITVTALSGQSKEYGQADPILQFTVEPPLDEGDAFTGSLSRVTGQNVGLYQITAGTLSAGPKYCINFVPADFIITPKPISVFADEQWKSYGMPDPLLTWSADPELFIGDSFTGSLDREEGEDAGKYRIVNKDLSAGDNYQIHFDDNILHITPITLQVFIENQTRVYGAANPPLTFSIEGFIEGDSLPDIDTPPDIRTSATNRSSVGNYSIVACCGEDNNYLFNYHPGNLSITPANLLIAANDQRCEWGNPPPGLTYSYFGLVNGDTATRVPPLLTTTATEESEAGIYPIKICCAEDSNYQIRYQEGALQVTVVQFDPEIIWSTPSDIIYGTLTSDYLLNATAVFQEDTLAGHYQYDPPVGTLLQAGAGQQLTVTFIPEDQSRFRAAHKSVEINVIPLDIKGLCRISDKTYDGTVAATIVERSIIGVLPVDAGEVYLMGGEALFSDPDAAAHKQISITGIHLEGSRAGNYQLAGVEVTDAAIRPVEAEAAISVDKDIYYHKNEIVTLTTTINNGAPLVAGGQQAAKSVTFRIDDQVMADASGQTELPLWIEPGSRNLQSQLSFTVDQIMSTGSFFSGDKQVIANFNQASQNFRIAPQEVVTMFSYHQGFEFMVYPNPSPGEVTFRITMDSGSRVILNLYTINGELLLNLLDEFIPANRTRLITYSGMLSHLGQGIYYYQCTDGRRLETGKIVIIQVFN